MFIFQQEKKKTRGGMVKSEFPPVESAINAGAVPLLMQCLSFGSPEEQV